MKYYYLFKQGFNNYQREELLKIAKSIKLETNFNEGNFWSTDIEQVNNLLPEWIKNFFHFPYRRIIFLHNKGNVLKHIDTMRDCVITFPLHFIAEEVSWWKKDKLVETLQYGIDPYLINTKIEHSVEKKGNERYFLQLPLDGTWDENVKYFKENNFIDGY